MVFAVLYACEWLFRGEKDAFGNPRACTYMEKQSSGPWDKQLQEWLSDTWLHLDAFHTGIYWNKECIQGCLNVNKYHKAFEDEKLQVKFKL